METKQNETIQSNGGAGQGATLNGNDSKKIPIIQEDMTECPVCMDDFDESKKNYIICGCNHKVCISCCKTYMETSSKPPHCMHCKIEWDRTFLYQQFTPSYVNKTLRMHRKNLLFEMEKAKMPETQHYIGSYNNLKVIYKMQQTYRDLKKKYKGSGITRGELIANDFLKIHPEIVEYYPEYERFRTQAYHKEIHLYQLLEDLYSVHHNKFRGRQQITQEKPKFIKACPSDNCKGFLNEKYYCSICETKVCRKCFAIKSTRGKKSEEKHTCKEEDIETAKLIKRDTKNCPSCGVPIHKILGCDQMWCTQCNVAFSWKTGQIENGVIHNPHYYEWMRSQQQHEGIRNVGEVVCGGLLNYRQINDIMNLCFGFPKRNQPHWFHQMTDLDTSILSPQFILNNETYHCLPFHQPKNKMILFKNEEHLLGRDIDKQFLSYINPLVDLNTQYTDTSIYTYNYLNHIHRNLLHFQQVILNPLRQKIRTQTNGRLHDHANYIHRIRYMINEISEKHFTTLLTKNDNIMDKERQILYIYELMMSFYSENMNLLYNDIQEYIDIDNQLYYKIMEYIPRQITKYIPDCEFNITKLDKMKAFCEVLFQLDKEYISSVVYQQILDKTVEYHATKSYLCKNYMKYIKFKKLLSAFIRYYMLYDDEYQGRNKGVYLNRYDVEGYYKLYGYSELPSNISMAHDNELLTLMKSFNLGYDDFINSYNDFINTITLYSHYDEKEDIASINENLVQTPLDGQEPSSYINHTFSFYDPKRFQLWIEFLDSKYNDYMVKSMETQSEHKREPYRKVAIYCKKKCLLYIAIQKYIRDIYNYDAFINPYDEKNFCIMKELYEKNPTMNYEHYNFYNYNMKKQNMYMIQKMKNSSFVRPFEIEYEKELRENWFGTVSNKDTAKEYYERLYLPLEKCGLHKLFHYTNQHFKDNSPYNEFIKTTREMSQTNIFRNMEMRYPSIIENIDKYTPLETGVFNYGENKTPYVIYSKQDIMDCIDNYYTPLKRINDFIILSNHMRNFCNERLYTISKNYNMRVPYIGFNLLIRDKMFDRKELAYLQEVLTQDTISDYVHDVYLNSDSKEFTTAFATILRDGLSLQKKYRIYSDK